MAWPSLFSGAEMGGSMKRIRTANAVVSLALLPGMARAESDGPACPGGHICASNPQGVADELRSLGYRAELKSHPSGDPQIESAAAGYDFVVNFNDCKANRQCRSLGFVIVFADDGKNTPQLANEWNRQKRFSQMTANENSSLAVTYDVTTVGGINKANFADIVDWWQVILGQLRTFFTERASK